MSKARPSLVAACLLSLASTAALAQGAAAPQAATPPGATTANEWTTWGYDQERTGWNRGETTLSKANVGKLKVQWKTQLSTPIVDVVLSTLTAPVIAAGVPTAQGPKNLMYILGADDVLFALDADTGKEVWRKAYPNPLSARKIATWLCSNTANATPVIDKAKGVIYFMASDGLLRGVNLADGAERLKPVEMVTPWARAWSLNLIDDVVYTTSGRACGEVRTPRSDWAMAMTPLTPRQIAARAASTEPPVDTDPSAVTGVDVSDPANPTVTRFFTSGGRPAGAWGRGGLAKGPGNSLILETSDGIYDPGSGQWGDSVLKLAPKAVRMQDSFTPENHAYILSKDLAGSASPVVFPFDGKTLVAQSQKESILYLLDANDMGGGKAANHAKALFKSPQLGNDIAAGTDPSSGVWGAITTYLTPDGRRFLYLPMWGPPSVHAPKFPVSAGATPNGSIMAFEVVKRGDAIVAEARWMSGDMVMPDPPTVANGVLYATSTGGQAKQNPLAPDGTRLVATTPESIKQRSTPVDNLKLYAFDAVTGKQLYSSKDTIKNWVHFGEPVVALGKVYLVTHDAQVIAFGLGK
jgi:outer membrane protein assembly factor BamB